MARIPTPRNICDNNLITIDSTSFTIGRSLSCNYTIGSVDISRFHCTILTTGDKSVLHDTSVNGTHVNSIRVIENADLYYGDCIRVGIDEDRAATPIIQTSRSSIDSSCATKVEGDDLSKPNTEDSKNTENAKENIVTKNEISDLDIVEKAFTCSICSELFVKAVTLSCSHTFCKYCIERWNKYNSNCPICRALISAGIPTILVDNIIEMTLSKESEEVRQSRRELIAEREEMLKHIFDIESSDDDFYDEDESEDEYENLAVTVNENIVYVDRRSEAVPVDEYLDNSTNENAFQVDEYLGNSTNENAVQVDNDYLSNSTIENDEQALNPPAAINAHDHNYFTRIPPCLTEMVSQRDTSRILPYLRSYREGHLPIQCPWPQTANLYDACIPAAKEEHLPIQCPWPQTANLYDACIPAAKEEHLPIHCPWPQTANLYDARIPAAHEATSTATPHTGYYSENHMRATHSSTSTPMLDNGDNFGNSMTTPHSSTITTTGFYFGNLIRPADNSTPAQIPHIGPYSGNHMAAAHSFTSAETPHTGYFTQNSMTISRTRFNYTTVATHSSRFRARDYGGYGRCHICNEEGHWANGCSNRGRENN